MINIKNTSLDEIKAMIDPKFIAFMNDPKGFISQLQPVIEYQGIDKEKTLRKNEAKAISRYC